VASEIADTPPRLRTKIGEAQKHREADASPEGVRRRRSAAIRVPTVLKAELIGPPMPPPTILGRMFGLGRLVIAGWSDERRSSWQSMVIRPLWWDTHFEDV
jgi:hypothetical protein